MFDIKNAVSNLPRKPGVYIMYNAEDTVIYVGKAKVLKNRVSSYFVNSKNHTAKVAVMVTHIARFDYIITDTEFEALVLECNLIKKYRPKYNVLLKDDKTFPYIKITLNEPYPQIFLTRKILNDGAKYFGPYHSSFVIYETINLIKKVFCVRSCKRNLPRDIGKERPCLNYHINQCVAPCSGNISAEDYGKIFSGIIKFIDGDVGEIKKELEEKMQIASENCEFEKAAKFRDKLFAINDLTEKQKIVSTNSNNSDIIGVVNDGDLVCIQMFFVRDGKISGKDNFVTKEEETDKGIIVSEFIKEYYINANYIPKNIVVGEEFSDKALIEEYLSGKAGSKIEVVIPKIGDKLRLLEMVQRNANEYLQLHILKMDKFSKKANDILFELKDILSLPNIPKRIESYDISNISGTNNVGVYVVFENGVPAKRFYRKFNITTVDGADDYGSMREVLYRRISNGVEGEEAFSPLPDLILLDGGKGQLSVGKEILDFFKLDIPMFGMVKDDKHRTRGLMTQNEEISLKPTSSVFKFITRIQDEVHRYAITTHREKRKKSALSSGLEQIKGVGEVKRKKLLKHFKSVKNIKDATIEELKEVVDITTATNIYNFYRQ